MVETEQRGNRRSGDDQPMHGKTVLITGTASGMGRIVARQLAGLGARLVLIDQDVANGESGLAEIRAASPNAEAEFFACDVTDFQAVRATVANIRSRYQQLDVLINNAGITESMRRESVMGFELTMATNFLAPVLITELLLPLLAATSHSRIINISSDAHKMIKELDFDDLDNRNGWSGVNHNKGFQAYARSKLSLAAYSFQLAAELEDSGISVYCVSPGYFIRTNIHRHMRGLWKLGVKVFWPLLQSPYKAAKTYVYLASDPVVATDSGNYWEHLKHKEPSPIARDGALQKRIVDYARRSIAG